MKEIIEWIIGQESEVTKAWLLENGYGWLGDNWLSLVEGGVPWAVFITLLSALGTAVRWAWKEAERRRRIKDLHPDYTKDDVREAMRYFIPTRFQSTAPSLEEEPGHNTKIAREPIIPKMLKEGFNGQDNERFHMVLAGSGMGKTTFMINLYVRYKRKWKLFGNKFNIYLFPLAALDIEQKIQAVKDKKNSILLLDALDEDIHAVEDYEARIDHLILGDGKKFEGVKDFREVLITCRTQFFPSEREEPNKTKLRIHSGEKGFHVFSKYYLSPFSLKDIRSYIRKRFSIFQFNKRLIAFAIVGKVPNLMVRPMLLSRIQDLVGDTKIGSFKNLWEFSRYFKQRWEAGLWKLENPLNSLSN